MKKVFGIIFLIMGVAMMVVGVAALTDASSKHNSYEGQIRGEFSESYQSNNEEQQAIGGGYLIVGFILFVTGIIMTASKSKKQRQKEIELKLIKDSHFNVTLTQEDPFVQIERLGKLKEQGLITEEEFHEQKNRLLKLV